MQHLVERVGVGVARERREVDHHFAARVDEAQGGAIEHAFLQQFVGGIGVGVVDERCQLDAQRAPAFGDGQLGALQGGVGDARGLDVAERVGGAGPAGGGVLEQLTLGARHEAEDGAHQRDATAGRGVVAGVIVAIGEIGRDAIDGIPAMPMRGRREGFGARAAQGLGVAGISGKRGVGRGRDLDALHLFVAVDGDREPHRAIAIEDRGIEGHLGAEVDGEDPALEVDGLRLAPQRRVGGHVGVERKSDVERAFDGCAVDIGQYALHRHLGRRGGGG